MKLSYFGALLLFTLALTGCYDEPDFLRDNVTIGRGYAPVIATFTSTNGTTFLEGDVAQLDLRYWSIDPIEEVVLYETIGSGARTRVAAMPYQANFAEDSQTDKMLLTYTIPDVPADVTSILVEAEVVNENGLTKTSSIKLNVTQ